MGAWHYEHQVTRCLCVGLTWHQWSERSQWRQWWHQGGDSGSWQWGHGIITIIPCSCIQRHLQHNGHLSWSPVTMGAMMGHIMWSAKCLRWQMILCLSHHRWWLIVCPHLSGGLTCDITGNDGCFYQFKGPCCSLWLCPPLTINHPRTMEAGAIIPQADGIQG